MTTSQDTLGVRQFVVGTAGWLNHAVESNQPLHIECNHRPHVTVVPTTLWERAQAALEREASMT